MMERFRLRKITGNSATIQNDLSCDRGWESERQILGELRFYQHLTIIGQQQGRYSNQVPTTDSNMVLSPYHVLLVSQSHHSWVALAMKNSDPGQDPPVRIALT
ncbi:MAG: hypothetical protein COB10_09220 [Planctomycetota bacterium]|nr:MAG: hypothetical protein COB10_09220 [Planctomycetota bacterium]